METDLEREFGSIFVDTINKSMNRDFLNLANRWDAERRKADALKHRQQWFTGKNIDSYAVINQVQAIDKSRIISQHGKTLVGLTVEQDVMKMIDASICDTMIEFFPGTTIANSKENLYTDNTDKSE